MAGEWEETTVGELVKRGVLERPLDGNHGSIHPKGDDFVATGVPFIMASDLVGGGIDTVNCSFISIEQAKSLRKGFAKSGDVLISHKATLGRTALVGEIPGDFVMLTPQVTYYRPKDATRLHNRYLKYYFDSEQFQQVLQSWAGAGSTRAYIGITDQLRLPVLLPPLAEQKAIAAVLGALDDKIELNRRMNATLEAIARALFQSWFVDFDPVRANMDRRGQKSERGRAKSEMPDALSDFNSHSSLFSAPAALDPATAALFPDSFQDSALGPIPHGWRAAHLEEIASVGSGKRPEGRCDVLSADCNIPLYGGGGQMGYVPSSLYDKPILFTGRVGTLGLIFRTAEPSWPSDNTLIVKPQTGFFDFTYFVLKGFDLITLNRGSTQPLLTQTDLKRQTFVLPTKDVVKAFADFSEPIFRQIVSNERESRTLATLRDTLLPKLLSGEITTV